MQVKCDYCGKIFNKEPNQVKRSKTHFCSRACCDNFKRNQKSANTKAEKPKNINDKDTLLKILQIGKSIDDLSEEYNLSQRIVIATIEDLKDDGYNITEIAGVYRLEKNIILTENIHNDNWQGEKVIRFGVVSDNHLCSKYQQLTFLNNLYDIFQREGLDTVYLPGDISDGFCKRRPGHIYELIPGCIGADEQADYIIKNYPQRNGIITEFITGNHDHWHITNGGVNIGRMIAKERNDLKYLGCSNAIINLTPNCKMELNHPEDGSAYALSYSLQKYIDSMSGGEKPNILLSGHYHKGSYFFYRNIHALHCGTTCGQTPWMRSHKIAAHVGGWIITVYVSDDGTVTRFVPEFIPLYHALKDDY